MNSFYQRIVLLLALIASVSLIYSATPIVRAQSTGLVCLDSSSSTSCPSSPPTFTGPRGSFLTVAINVRGSDSFNGFDIRVQANPSILNGTSINLAGSVLPNQLVVDECINGFFMGGACQSSPGIVEVIIASQSSTTAPTTGRLFSVTYDIVGTTTGTPITYPTGCTSSSVAGTTTCVAVSNAGTVVPENVQAATFSSTAPPPPPDFTITATPASRSVTRGSSTTFSVTVTGTNGFNVTVNLTTNVSPSVRHSPVASVPATVGPYSTSTLIVSTIHSTPTGTYTITVTGTSGSLSHSTSVTVIVTR